MKAHRILPFLLIGFAINYTHAAVEKHTIHVSTKGEDTSDGSIQSPLRSIEAAQRLAQQLRNQQSEQAIVIELAPGVYELDTTLKFSENDSGLPSHPLTIQGANHGRNGEPQVVVSGGRTIYGFQPVKDPQILQRLPEEAHGKVLSVNLKEQGITDLGKLHRRGFALSGSGSLKLYYGGEPMPMARWPNTGWAVTTLLFGDPSEVGYDRSIGVNVTSERLRRWAQAEEVWAHGYWYHGWADEHAPIESIDPEAKSITFSQRHRYGYNDDRHFYVYNLIEELDQPGEWYLNPQTGDLYFWPPESVSPEMVSCVVTVLDSPLLQFDNTSHIRIRNIAFRYGRSHAILVRDGRDIEIDQCSLSNFDRTAISIQDGYGHKVLQSHLFNLNESAIRMQGGDRLQLLPGNHKASDNHIHDYALWTRTYRGAIEMVGVGIEASHNLIHDAPHVAIRFSGNNHTIRNNEIFRVVTESDDAGAIYAGRDWSARGTRIEDNFIYMSGITFREHHAPENHMPVSRHFHSSALIYLDDLLSGIVIQGNILQGVDATIKVGGGRDNLVNKNVIVGGERGVRLDARGLAWANPHVVPGGRFRMWERLEEVNFNEPPYSEAYPELVTLPDNQPYAPIGNKIQDNFFIGVEHPLYFLHGADEYVTKSGNRPFTVHGENPATFGREEIEALISSKQADEDLPIDVDFTRFGPRKSTGK
ncbi:MAG: right-handed parallel beta-helix repeat-containing protein [Opitutales bacterium]|nr:right-handed parallel beta-helix repeat-containing protein [Opitutales bacterium]